MKTNLDSLYKTNSNFETNGVWFEISDDIAFLVRRFGGNNAEKVKKAHALYCKPYIRQIQNGTLEPQKERTLLIRAFVEACVADWKGVEIDGEKADFSTEKAVEFFCALPDLAEELISYAQDTQNYKEELGNS